MGDARRIRTLDAEELCALAWTLDLDPRDPVGRRLYGWKKCHWGEAATDACGALWRPHERLAEADAVFRIIRAHGWSTSCAWFADDRQYGEAWAATAGNVAHSVRWPSDVPTEAHALLLVSILCAAHDDAERQEAVHA